MQLPPGPAFILARLPRALVPLFVVYALSYAGEQLTSPDTPWILRSGISRMLLIALSLPLSAVVNVLNTERRKRKEAAALGAVAPPVAEGKLPGNVDVLLAMGKSQKSGYMADIMKERSIKNGCTFNLRVVWEDKIITSEPEIVKAVLATEFSNFEKGTLWRIQMQDLLGDGVFNADGDLWKFHRMMTRPFFSRERISHFELFGRHADTAIAAAKVRVSAGIPVDVQDLVSRFTLDSATEFLFGHCVHALGAPLPYPHNFSISEKSATGFGLSSRGQDAASCFAEAFAAAQLVAAKRGRFNSVWPLMEFWKRGTADPMGVIDAYIDPILREAVAKKRALGMGPANAGKEREIEDGDTLLDHLIHQTEDTKVLKDEILNIMIAGRDTTAALLTFAIYCLAENPELYTRLREEVLSVIGSDRSPTYENLREMKYLRAVLNETLRLYPPVPFDQRSSIKATTVPNPTPGAKPWYVPAQTKVIYSVFTMHRRPDLWGPDAHIYDPDRFLDARVAKYLTPNPFIFLPFNAGPRICLGQQFAYNEASFMLARFCQAFDVVELSVDSMPEDARVPASWSKAEVGDRKRVERVWPKSHLTMFVHGGLWVRLHEAAPVESA